MHWCLFAIVVLSVPLVYGYDANAKYVTFAKCDQKVVKSIETFWNETNSPYNFLKRMDEIGTFTVYYTSYSYKNTHNKCIYLNVTDGVVDVIFHPKDGGPAAKMVFKVEEGEDHIIRGRPMFNDAPEHRFKWYEISLKNGVSVYYVCGDVDGSDQPPIVAVKVADHHRNNGTEASIAHAVELLNERGLNMTYSYGATECSLSNSVE